MTTLGTFRKIEQRRKQFRNKNARIILWLIPFLWPIAIWRTLRASKIKREVEIRKRLAA